MSKQDIVKVEDSRESGQNKTVSSEDSYLVTPPATVIKYKRSRFMFSGPSILYYILCGISGPSLLIESTDYDTAYGVRESSRTLLAIF